MKITFTFHPTHGVPASCEAKVPEAKKLATYLDNHYRFVVADSDGNEGEPYMPSSYDDLLDWLKDELAGFDYAGHGCWEASLRVYDEQDECHADFLIEVEPLEVTTEIEIDAIVDGADVKGQGTVEWMPGEWFGIGFLRGETLEEGYEIFLEEDRFSGFFEPEGHRVSLQQAAEMATRELVRRIQKGERLQPEIVFFVLLDVCDWRRPVSVASRIKLEIESAQEPA